MVSNGAWRPGNAGLHTLHELARHEAQRYGGLVRAVSGESVLIVFGAPVAQEDHAPRAVLTALSMQRQLAGGQGTRASPAWQLFRSA